MIERFEDRSIDKMTGTPCPDCKNSVVLARLEHHEFIYGSGDDAVKLSTTVPLNACTRCKLEFLDHRAEDARHEAVCRYLGVMTPKEILSVRSKHDMSRSEFAELTRLGDATIARWERGALVQSAANALYLYLLQFPENVERLREKVTRNTFDLRVQDKTPIFRVLDKDKTDSLRPSASVFKLSA